MTIFAGAYGLDPNQPLPAGLADQLRKHVSRFEADTPDEYSAPGFFSLTIDIKAFDAPGGLVDETGAITTIAGEPLLADGEGDATWDRSRDAALLHGLFKDGRVDGLRRARGTFCGFHYGAAQHRLTLFVDKVGVRPVYVWELPGLVIFASALRILEALTPAPKQFDLRGVTEVAAFSFPLADRTPYLAIKMLKAGETVQLGGGQIKRELYWRWDGPIDAIGYEQGVQRAYDAFINAIKRRQRNTTAAAAFLSGGLDSRVIVGGLAASGSTLYTVNYAPDGSQDQVFAKLVADQLGTRHAQLQTNAANVGQGYRKAAVNAWIGETFERTPIMWSGDGGSVGLGNVYMTPEIVGAMERGALDEAINLFTKGIPARIFKRGSVDTLSSLPFQGVMDELEAIDSPDPGRRFHLFLMLNDQRRHLAQHFEDIDIDRIEFQLPFFDADFLDSVLRLPNDWLMAHKFYMDWLALFPNALDSIPFQAYPGHIPCTLPMPAGLKYQWDVYYDKAMYAQMRRNSAASAREMLAKGRFPDHLISRPVLRLASLLTGSGVRDYSYLIKTAAVYHRYWAATEDCAA